MARRLVADREGRTAEVSRLVVQDGSCCGQELRLEKQGQPYRIGRSASCQMVVADDDMSREHAEIERRWDGVFVRDLGSKNGVLLHGQRLTSERRLADGDIIEMGQTHFKLDDPNDRTLRQVQDGAVPVSDRQKDPADTRTASRVSVPEGTRSGWSSPQVVGTGRMRPWTLLVIAAVVLLGTIALAVSFLLAR